MMFLIGSVHWLLGGPARSAAPCCSAGFCSAKRAPTRAECFMNLSQHLLTHPSCKQQWHKRCELQPTKWRRMKKAHKPLLIQASLLWSHWHNPRSSAPQGHCTSSLNPSTTCKEQQRTRTEINKKGVGLKEWKRKKIEPASPPWDAASSGDHFHWALRNPSWQSGCGEVLQEGYFKGCSNKRKSSGLAKALNNLWTEQSSSKQRFSSTVSWIKRWVHNRDPPSWIIEKAKVWQKTEKKKDQEQSPILSLSKTSKGEILLKLHLEWRYWK